MCLVLQHRLDLQRSVLARLLNKRLRERPTVQETNLTSILKQANGLDDNWMARTSQTSFLYFNTGRLPGAGMTGKIKTSKS